MSAAVAFVLGLLLMPVLVGLLMGWLYLREAEERTAAKRPSLDRRPVTPPYHRMCRSAQMWARGRRIWTTIHAESDRLAAEAVVALMEREEA